MRENKELEVFGQFMRQKKKPKIDKSNRTKGVIYTRVSSKEQLDGASLETQMEFCQN